MKTTKIESFFMGHDDKEYEARYFATQDEDGNLVDVKGEYFIDGEWKNTHEDSEDIEEMLLDEMDLGRVANFNCRWSFSILSFRIFLNLIR